MILNTMIVIGLSLQDDSSVTKYGNILTALD